MAKAYLNNREKQISRSFTMAYILLTIVFMIAATFIDIIYVNGKNMYNNNLLSQEHIAEIDKQLLSLNSNVLMIVGGFPDVQDKVENISSSFRIIEEEMKEYEDIEHGDNENHRYNQTKLFINAYHEKMLGLQNNFQELNSEIMRNIFTQEIQPLQVTATEMLSATIDISRIDAEKALGRNTTIAYTLQVVLIVVWLGSYVAIYVSKKNMIKNSRELETREREVKAAGMKLERSQEKMQDIALMNILTGMKNRYALEGDIADRLENDQFNIGVFDIDNFRMINDTYGYEFGDEYLAAIAERLLNEFSEFAEIYNISGNEFCFIFHDDVPDSQAQRMAEKVCAAMNDAYEIANLVIQTTTSGSIYHYLPGDCINTNALLIKMDTALHDAKRNGGNVLYTINSL